MLPVVVDGRPPIYPEEVEQLDAHLARFLPALRPEARTLVERHGYLSRRRRLGLPMLRVQGGWRVFFNQGCVLHKVGAREGDKYRYKPSACALFPLSRTATGEWYVRQKGVEDDDWDLFCLDPAASPMPARQSLAEEVRLAEGYTAEEERKKKNRKKKRAS